MHVLNSEQTMKRLMNDAEFVGELYATFLETMTARVGRMETMIANGELDALWKEAHGLKGASGTINAEKLHDCAYAIETAARSDDANAVQTLWIELQERVREVQEAIDAWLAARG